MSDIKPTVTEIYSRPQIVTSKPAVQSGNVLPNNDSSVVKGSSVKPGVEVSLQSQSADKTIKNENGGLQVSVKATEEQKEQGVGVKEAVSKLNDYVQNMERKLEFEMDDYSGVTVIKVFDKESDEVIRQLPSEEALALARSLNKSEPLILFSAQV
jgi:flagellar protein FlaG